VQLSGKTRFFSISIDHERAREARTHELRKEPAEGGRSSQAGSSDSGGARSGARYASSSSHSGNTRHASSQGSDDLKSREYRGPDGEVHHHTKEYMEQHGGKK
jgi:hypothetical protein